MNTSTQKRITRFSGLLLLALLVVALSVTAAQAMRVYSAGTGVPPTSAGSGTSTAAPSQPGFAWGYYSSGVSTNDARQLHALLQGSTLAQVPQHQGGAASTSAGSGTVSAAAATDGWLGVPPASAGSGTVSAVPPASSGTSSTTVWIAVGAAVAVLIIALVAWALIRRRRRPGELAPSANCTLHPEDPLCGGA